MPEFKAAGADYRAGPTLAARCAALWIAGAPLAVSAIVGGAQRRLIRRGPRRERRTTEAQARSLDAQTRSLETPLERAAPKREGDR